MSAISHFVKNSIFSIQNRAGSGVRSWFSFTPAVENRCAQISIDDEIGGWGISARRLVDQIKSLGPKDEIKLHIYSPGGDVLEANEIYNALNEHEGKVHVSIGALCASAATIIACVGDTVEMAENGLFMIHNPWTIGYGDAGEFRRVADILSKFKTNIVASYTKRTGLNESVLSKLMDDETWMTAEEAVEKKFVDTVKEAPEEDEEKVENRFDLSRYKNSASALSRLPKNARPETSPDAVKSKQKPSPETKPSQSTNQSTFIDEYMKNSSTLRIFAALAGSIAANIPALKDVTETNIRVSNIDPPAPGTPEYEQAVIAGAKKLFAAKQKRDTEIDEIVNEVIKRDKKDFSALAKEYKDKDMTAADFSMAIVRSDNFKNVGTAPVGSGSEIEVLGVVGIDKGTPGEMFIASEEYRALVDRFKNGKGKGNNSIAIETNGFMASAMNRFMNVSTSTGLTSIEKLPGVVTLGVRPLTVKDLIAPGATSNTQIRYIREVSFTNGADTVAEGATKPAASFSLEEVNANVTKIAAYTKVTDELFADYLAVASYINQRLPYMVERTEEDQLLNGDGTGQNLTGLLNTPGIQSLAKGGNTAPDAIYKAFTKVRWGNLAGTAQGGFEPDATIMHPTDWEAIRLMKDENGQYFGGGPMTGAYGNGGMTQFESIWAKPVVVTPAIAQGTALVGAFRLGSQYFMRQGLTIQSTNTDQDDFIKNLTTIRAELRLALAVYRPLVFCKVTGLGA